MPQIEFPTASTTAPGYLAAPDTPDGRAVLVLHEGWGLDDQLRGVCDRLAAEGWVAVAPDLYDGVVAADMEQATTLMSELLPATVDARLAGAAEAARERAGASGVAVVGFSMGGALALHAAALGLVDRVVSFYPYLTEAQRQTLDRLDVPVLVHFATADAFVSLDDAQAAADRLPLDRAQVVWYDGAGHSFVNESDRLGTYDEAQARRAWKATTSFLAEPAG